MGRNIGALRAARALEQTTNALGGSLERLGSGMRINRASDDAAGLAIADGLRASARIYGQAIRNVNDGISAVHIATGALDQQSQLLERMLELAQQASNGSYNSTQRGAMMEEYRTLAQEFGRLGDSTTFNGINLLRSSHTGGSSALQIQAGLDSSSTSTISVAMSDTGSLSGVFDVSRLASANWDGSTAPPVLNVSDFSALLNWTANLGAEDAFDSIASRFNNNVLSLKIADSAGNRREVLVAFAKSYGGGDSASSLAVMTFTKNSNGIGYAAGANNFSNYISGNLTLDTNTGQLANANAVSLAVSGIGNISLDLSGLRFLSSSANSAIEFSGIETQSRALDALTTVQNRLIEVQTAYGNYGAAESRFQVSLNVLGSSKENSLAAESRIRDVDVASESANLVRLQILQQAGTAVLAQSQFQQRLALQLLQF